MKKTFKAFALMLLTALAFSSCVDVPVPYNLPDKGSGSGGNGGSTVDEGIAATCAQAVELTKALADGATSTETYTITGYITEVVGDVSRNQQTFWMADTKNGGRIFEAYWANLPEGVTAFAVGTKVKITGKLMKYVSNAGNVTPEMKNAIVTILEDGDTPPVEDGISVTCAKAVELTNALADNGISTETYTVTGYITEVVGSVSKNQQTFWMADTKDGGKVFEAYWANLPEGVTEFKVGMKVKITGQLLKYVKGTNITPEIKNASVVVLEDDGSGGTNPPVVEGTEITCAQAVELTNALADGGISSETYTITGYITEVFGNVSRNQQSFWMADTKDGGNVFEAYWANLPEGVSEFKVGMKVKITGNLLKYVKDGNVTPEIKNANVVILEDDGGGDTPTPGPGGETLADLVNGSFESWESDTELLGWKPSGSSTGPGNAVYSQNRDSHEGAFSCFIAANGSTNMRLSTQELTLSAGTYTFSYYAKAVSANPTQTRCGYVPVTNGTVGTYNYSGYFDLNDSEWSFVSYEFTLEAETVVCLFITNPKNNTKTNYVAQDILVDDATLIKK